MHQAEAEVPVGEEEHGSNLASFSRSAALLSFPKLLLPLRSYLAPLVGQLAGTFSEVYEIAACRRASPQRRERTDSGASQKTSIGASSLNLD